MKYTIKVRKTTETYIVTCYDEETFKDQLHRIHSDLTCIMEDAWQDDGEKVKHLTAVPTRTEMITELEMKIAQTKMMLEEQKKMLNALVTEASDEYWSRH